MKYLIGAADTPEDLLVSLVALVGALAAGYLGIVLV